MTGPSKCLALSYDLVLMMNLATPRGKLGIILV